MSLTNIQNIYSTRKIRTKQDLSYISICSLNILYNSKFILMATFLGTDAVVVTRVLCINRADVLISVYLGLDQCIICIGWSVISLFAFIPTTVIARLLDK